MLNAFIRKKGTTLIELLIVLSIIFGIIVTIIGISRATSESAKIQSEQKNIKAIQIALRSTFAYGSYAGLTNSIALKAKAFPTQMVNNGIVRSTLGGLVSVHPNSNSAFFDIKYSDITASTCIKFAPLITRDFYSVKIASTLNPSHLWNAESIATACSQAPLVEIVFTSR